MGRLALALFATVFVCTLLYPPSSAITVPACSLIWIVAYLGSVR